MQTPKQRRSYSKCQLKVHGFNRGMKDDVARYPLVGMLREIIIAKAISGFAA